MNEATDARSVSSVYEYNDTAMIEKRRRLKKAIEANRNMSLIMKRYGQMSDARMYDRNLQRAKEELAALEKKISAPITPAAQNGFFHRVVDRFVSYIGFGEIA